MAATASQKWATAIPYALAWRPAHVLQAPLPAACACAWPDPAPRPCLMCSPQFVLPVFRGPNARENFFVQCQLPLVLFTSVEEYKR